MKNMWLLVSVILAGVALWLQKKPTPEAPTAERPLARHLGEAPTGALAETPTPAPARAPAGQTFMLPGPQSNIPIETGPLPEPQPPEGAHRYMVSVYGQTNFKPCMTTMTGVPRWTTWRIVFSPPGGGWLTVYVGNYYYKAVNIYYVDPNQVPPVKFVDYLVNVTALVSFVGKIDMGAWHSVRLKPGVNRVDIKFPQK